MSINSHKLLGSAVAGAILLLGAVTIANIPGHPLVSGAYAAGGIRALSNVCLWDDIGWDEMTGPEKQAWSMLGWDQTRWESDDDGTYPTSASEDWDELQPTERTAAAELGFTPASWDASDNCQ